MISYKKRPLHRLEVGADQCQRPCQNESENELHGSHFGHPLMGKLEAMRLTHCMILHCLGRKDTIRRIIERLGVIYLRPSVILAVENLVGIYGKRSQATRHYHIALQIIVYVHQSVM